MKKVIILGIGHGINDCIAGYILGALYYQGHSLFQLGIFILLYHLIAFGGQLPFARILEHKFQPKRYLLACFSLLIGALIFLDISPELAIVFSGVASAIIHVTGGVEAIGKNEKAFGIGIFASPGIIGLIGGGFMASAGINFVLPGILVCFSYLTVLSRFFTPSKSLIHSEKKQATIEGHDVLMAIILTIICLRSFIWDIIQMVERENYNALAIIAVAAMCGKIIGGFAADKIGYKKY